jgi:hypothetical protein
LDEEKSNGAGLAQENSFFVSAQLPTLLPWLVKKRRNTDVHLQKRVQ